MMRYFNYIFTIQCSGWFFRQQMLPDITDCCLLSFLLKAPSSSSSGMRGAGGKSQLRTSPVPAGLMSRTPQSGGINPSSHRQRGCTTTRVLLTLLSQYFPFLNWFHNVSNLQNCFLFLFAPFFSRGLPAFPFPFFFISFFFFQLLHTQHRFH